MTFRSEDNTTGRSIQFSKRVECPRHGQTMVLIRHRLSEHGAHMTGIGSVTFFRCTVFTDGQQCTFMRANKYQKRKKGERHK